MLKEGRNNVFDKLTEIDIKKMQEEIDHRKLVVRKEALEAVKEARAHGDLSENFEYHAAKKDKNQNESRIRYLEKMIKTAQVISDESKDDEIGLYNTVDLYFEDDDEEETYKLVTTVRGNSMKGLISSESPLGKAVMGHKLGDRVYVKVNDNTGYYVVVKRLENTKDDGSEKLRSY
jgi:transcription elongation factor GreA